MSKNNKVIYTCISGNYDTLKSAYKEKTVDYLAFTDDLTIDPCGWELIDIKNVRETNISKNRFVKMRPDLFLGKYEKSLYIDGNIKVIGPLFEYFDSITNYPANYMSIPVHPLRSTLNDEIIDCIKTHKINEYDGIKFYNKALKEFPNINNNRITENSIIFRYHNDPRSKLIGAKWFDNFKNIVSRDQLLLDYTLMTLDLDILRCNINLRKFNFYIYYSPHNVNLPTIQLIKSNIIKYVNSFWAKIKYLN